MRTMVPMFDGLYHHEDCPFIRVLSHMFFSTRRNPSFQGDHTMWKPDLLGHIATMGHCGEPTERGRAGDNDLRPAGQCSDPHDSEHEITTKL